MIMLKPQLYALCMAYANERLLNAQHGIDEARASSAGETKSSAGDKYETGRAMAQQEIDRNTVLLAEAQQLINALNKINPTLNSPIVITSSLVVTNKAKFYVSISAGAITLKGEKYFAVSPVSPIGLKLISKKAGDSFEMNGTKYLIEEVL